MLTVKPHISEAFNILSRKYNKGLHFIFGADANHLKLDSILALRADMRSVVEEYTRLGPPPTILDSIITTLGFFYQRPVCYPPLDADEGTGGVPTDHLIVKMSQINMVTVKLKNLSLCDSEANAQVSHGSLECGYYRL